MSINKLGFSLVSIHNITFYNRIENDYNIVIVGWTFNYNNLNKMIIRVFEHWFQKNFN